MTWPWRRRGSSVEARLEPTMTAIRTVAADAQRSRLPQMAAALSYRTVFGLLPVLAIGLWILHRLLTPDDLARLIDRGITLLGLKSIVVDEGPAAAAPAGASWFAGPVMPGALAPSATAADAAAIAASGRLESLEHWVRAFVERINEISFKAIGLVGIVMLIYAGISMVVEVERAFNQIYRVPRGRSWMRRAINYWALLTLGPICLFATFFIGVRLNTWVAGLAGHGAAGDLLASAVATVGVASQFLISTLLLVVVYQVVPNTRVRFWPSLTGAVIAAALFEGSKYAFGLYVQYSAGVSFGRLYGSLALIPLFLLWVYFIWLITLFGLQLAYQLQHGRARTHAQPNSEGGPALVEPTSALVIMRTLARSFADGVALDAPAIAQRTRLADPIVRAVLARVAERGFVHRIDSPDTPGGRGGGVEPTYSLARPPAAITVAELLVIGHDLAGGGGAADDPVIARLRQAQVAAAGRETLADVTAVGATVPAGAASHPPRPQDGPLSPALLRPRPEAAGRAGTGETGGVPPVPVNPPAPTTGRPPPADRNGS